MAIASSFVSNPFLPQVIFFFHISPVRSIRHFVVVVVVVVIRLCIRFISIHIKFVIRDIFMICVASCYLLVMLASRLVPSPTIATTKWCSTRSKSCLRQKFGDKITNKEAEGALDVNWVAHDVAYEEEATHSYRWHFQYPCCVSRPWNSDGLSLCIFGLFRVQAKKSVALHLFDPRLGRFFCWTWTK